MRIEILSGAAIVIFLLWGLTQSGVETAKHEQREKERECVAMGLQAHACD